METYKENREDLILSNIRYVHTIAHEYFNQDSGIGTYEDFVQSGIEGLIEAVDRYDPEKGSLTTYATYWIKKKIFELMDRSKYKLSGIDRTTGAVYRRIDRIIEDLQQQKEYYNDIPSDEEIKNHPKFKEVLEKSRVKTPDRDRSEVILERYFLYRHDLLYYEGIGFESNSDDFPDAFSRYLEDKSESFEDSVSNSDFLLSLLEKTLTNKQQMVLKHYYGLDGIEPLNYREIGEILNLSRGAIYDIHKKSLKILKKVISNDHELFSEYKLFD